jgi:hypothetical protein
VFLGEALAGGKKLAGQIGTSAQSVAMLRWPSTAERSKFILRLLLISDRFVPFLRGY